MSDLESMCNIDKGTYTDAPVLTADIRKLFKRIAELEEELKFHKVEIEHLRKLFTIKRWEARCKKLEADNKALREALEKILGVDDEQYDVYDCILWAKAALQEQGNEM